MKTLQLLDLATETSLPINPTLVRGGMRYTTGLHSLLQRVVFYLGNDLGSVAISPTIGSSRVQQLYSASLAELTYVQTIVAGIQADLELYLKASTLTLPDDAKFGSVELTISELTEEAITIDVLVTSVAGDSAVYNYSLILSS